MATVHSSSLQKGQPLDFGCAHLNHLASIYGHQGKAIAEAFEAGEAEPVFDTPPLPPCMMKRKLLKKN